MRRGKIKYFLCGIILSLIYSCSDPSKLTEEYAKKLEDSLHRAEKAYEEKNKIKFPAYIYLDNPTDDPIIFQLGNKKDTLPPYVYEKHEIESGNNKLIIYNSEGKAETDTTFFTDLGQDVLLNISHSNYFVLMSQYKDFIFEVPEFKTPQQMLMDELTRPKEKKTKHEFPTPNPAGDQHRAYEQKTFKRRSTTNPDYDITQYYQITRIGKKELIIPKYWDLDPTDYFKGSENLNPETKDSYLRQLVREQDLEIKQYFGSGESGQYKSGDEIMAIFNIKYINSLVQCVKMVRSYDKKVIDEIRSGCKDCEDFFNTMNTLASYTGSTKGLHSLSKDFNKLLKKYSVKDSWRYCNSKSETSIKKHFFKEHVESINLMIQQSVY